MKRITCPRCGRRVKLITLAYDAWGWPVEGLAPHATCRLSRSPLKRLRALRAIEGRRRSRMRHTRRLAARRTVRWRRLVGR